MRKLIAGIVASIWLCSSIISGVYAQGTAPTYGGPDFSLEDLAGETYQLSSYQGKQPVLLFFWTTWCPFCLNKLKEMNQGYIDLEKDGVALLAINAGERRSSVERLVRNYAIKYTVLVDEEGVVSEDYHVLGVPTFILIDKKGAVRYKGNEYPRSAVKQLISK
ncbi:MAG: TlpA disulfide reductase family protein [Candidatus Omnitrophota bacterium]